MSKLLEYLPPFLREYREFNEIANAEEPEFDGLSEKALRVLKNQFIETADEDGIAEFEKMLGILPSKSDSLASRRARVFSRWFTELPYTLKAFLHKLSGLSEYGNIAVSVDFDRYLIAIDTDFEYYGQTDEIERLVDLMFPCNIIAELKNTVRLSADGEYKFGGAVSFTETSTLSSDIADILTAKGGAVGAAVQFAELIGI